MANLKEEMIVKLRDSTSEITHSSDEIFAGNNNFPPVPNNRPARCRGCHQYGTVVRHGKEQR